MSRESTELPRLSSWPARVLHTEQESGCKTLHQMVTKEDRGQIWPHWQGSCAHWHGGYNSYLGWQLSTGMGKQCSHTSFGQ